VTQTCSIDAAGKSEHRWEHRLHAAAPRAPHNDNHAGDGLCPACGGYASTGPLAAEYCGKGLIHRHWTCRACGHEWVTVLHVLT
jgi:hypothetical protein